MTRDIFVRFRPLKQSKRAALYTAFCVIATHASPQKCPLRNAGQIVLPKAHGRLRRIKDMTI